MTMIPFYERDGITIYCGDCLEILPGLKPPIDAVITDPPYGLNKKMQGGTWGATRFKLMQWDARPLQNEIDFLTLLAPIVVIWGGNYYTLPPSRGWICWYKPDSPPTMADFELAWTNQDTNSFHVTCSIAETNAERVGHPTQKPLKVMRRCVEKLTSPGDLILDPFMGSGTTLRAAQDLSRRAIGIEISEDYCRIAVDRLRQPSFFSLPNREPVAQPEQVALF